MPGATRSQGSRPKPAPESKSSPPRVSMNGLNKSQGFVCVRPGVVCPTHPPFPPPPGGGEGGSGDQLFGGQFSGQRVFRRFAKMAKTPHLVGVPQGHWKDSLGGGGPKGKKSLTEAHPPHAVVPQPASPAACLAGLERITISVTPSTYYSPPVLVLYHKHLANIFL